MPTERYFLEAPLNGTVILEGKEFHHLSNVIRQKEGETVELIDGKGTLAKGKIETLHKRHASIEILEKEKFPQPEVEIILAQALPRINRLDTIVEKCTELGMTELWLFAGEKSERRALTEHQLERLKGLTIAATKQSGRLWLPSIKWTSPIREWEKQEIQLLFGSLDHTASSLLGLSKSNTMIVIGPESGLTENETSHLINIEGKGVSLGAYTLRTDTAAISALAVISCS